MHELHELKEKLMSELKKYGSKDMNASTLEMVDKLAHATKNLCKIMEDAGEYSERGMGRDVSYYGGTSYDMDYAGARGRGRNARRDAMGRYSSTGDLVAELREVMGEVRDPSTRADFERLIEKVERM